jgi:hypothetical protein
MSDALLYTVKLTAAEMMLLDGRVGPEAQEEVDLAKEATRIAAAHGLGERAARFVAATVRVAARQGFLVMRGTTSMASCPVTGKSPETVRKSKRSSEMVTRPLPVYELNGSRVVIIGYPRLGVTAEGLVLIRPALAAELSKVRAQWPEKLLGAPCPWRREDVVRCAKCGWSGREGEAHRHCWNKRHRVCPSCGAVEQDFEFGQRTFEAGDGFAVVPADTPGPKLWDPRTGGLVDDAPPAPPRPPSPPPFPACACPDEPDDEE